MVHLTRKGFRISALLLAGSMMTAAAQAEPVEIQVSSYNAGMSGQIWAVALEKGFCKDLGLDLEIRSSTGGGGDIRALMASDMPYIETGLSATLAGIQEGFPLKIVSDNVISVGSTVWFADAASPVNTLQDLKGHKLSYSSPKSVTHVVNLMLLDKLGYTTDDVELVAAGSLATSLTMMEAGGLDVVTAGNQIYYAAPEGKYKLIGKVSEELPSMTNVVGVTTDRMISERPDVIRKLIECRRSAVQFLEANPDEAADIMARAAQWDVDVTKRVVDDLKGGIFWNEGGFGEDLQRMVDGLVMVEAIDASLDWQAAVDEQFLPDDLKSSR